MKKIAEPDDTAWVSINLIGDQGDVFEVHTLPVADADGHQAGLTCHCDPQINFNDDEGNPLPRPHIVHNSFDGREALAWAKLILNLPQ